VTGPLKKNDAELAREYAERAARSGNAQEAATAAAIAQTHASLALLESAQANADYLDAVRGRLEDLSEAMTGVSVQIEELTRQVVALQLP
jgi:hypothetical protein